MALRSGSSDWAGFFSNLGVLLNRRFLIKTEGNSGKASFIDILLILRDEFSSSDLHMSILPFLGVFCTGFLLRERVGSEGRRRDKRVSDLNTSSTYGLNEGKSSMHVWA